MRAIGFCCVLMLLLGIAATASGCTEVVKYVCPSLSNAPNSTLDALEVQARKDPATASWVIDLDRHYQKCDEVNKKK
jgi:hypothetical protein